MKKEMDGPGAWWTITKDVFKEIITPIRAEMKKEILRGYTSPDFKYSPVIRITPFHEVAPFGYYDGGEWRGPEKKRTITITFMVTESED